MTKVYLASQICIALSSFLTTLLLVGKIFKKRDNNDSLVKVKKRALTCCTINNDHKTISTLRSVSVEMYRYISMRPYHVFGFRADMKFLGIILSIILIYFYIVTSTITAVFFQVHIYHRNVECRCFSCNDYPLTKEIISVPPLSILCILDHQTIARRK